MTLYLCDPRKNKKCRKTNCFWMPDPESGMTNGGGQCALTDKLEYAVTEGPITLRELNDAATAGAQNAD